MVMLLVIFVVIVIFIIATVFFILTLDNFKGYLIRINEAEANIETILNKRFDLLNKSIDVIKNVLDTDKEIIGTISNIRSQKLDNFQLDEKLYDAIKEFHEYSEIELELAENDEYTKIEIDLIESESEIVALKKYYNDIVEKYNSLVEAFPYSIIASIKKFKLKEEFKITDNIEIINSLKKR